MLLLLLSGAGVAVPETVLIIMSPTSVVQFTDGRTEIAGSDGQTEITGNDGETSTSGS